MTERKDALTELLEKVEAGQFPGDKTGPQMGFPDTSAAVLYDAFSGSLDAAKALHEAVLPGWGWRIAQCHVSDDAWVTAPDDSLAPDGTEWAEYTDVDQRPPGNPARAWLIAILKALIAREDTPDAP